MTDFEHMDRLPLKPSRELMKYLAKHGHVVHTIRTPYGTVMECDDYVLQATPEELEARRRHAQEVAAQLRDKLREP